MAETELMVIRGATDGTNTTGTFSLLSDLIYGNVTFVRIPKGMKAKIWWKTLSGEGETLVSLQYTHDVTASSPTYIDIEKVKLNSMGELSLEKRRPVVLHGFNGKEAFRLTWVQPNAKLAYIEIGVEFE